MVWSVSSAVRDLPRLREISSVLIRHGLGDVVRRAGIASLLERAGQVLHWGEAGQSTHLVPQQRVRLACEELGQPSSNWAKSSQRVRTCCHRHGPRSLLACTVR